MKVRVCPECGKHNPENAWNCVECGSTLSVKTVMATDPGGAFSRTQEAGHVFLPDISSCFHDDINETIPSALDFGEEIIWGCNFYRPPARTGYLVITSRKLICVDFAAKSQKQKSHFTVNAFDFIVNILAENESLLPFDSEPAGGPGVVPYPDPILSAAAKNSRRIITYELRDIVSTRLEQRWREEVLTKRITFTVQKNRAVSIKKDAFKTIRPEPLLPVSKIKAFIVRPQKAIRGSRKVTLFFYVPHHANSVHEILCRNLSRSA